MNWKCYREYLGSRIGDVIIECDPADVHHPYVETRVLAYRSAGTFVTLLDCETARLRNRGRVLSGRRDLAVPPGALL